MSYNMIEGKDLILTDEGLYEPILNSTFIGRTALKISRRALIYEYEKQFQAHRWKAGDMHYCIFIFPWAGALVYLQMEQEEAIEGQIEYVTSYHGPKASLYGLKSNRI